MVAAGEPHYPKRTDALPAGPARGWRLDDIPFDAIDSNAVRGDDYLFHLLSAASFVEITSDLYASNLVDYFSGDAPVQQWLSRRWRSEEVQHGQALKRYVTHVWPEFNWQSAYDGFFAEYSRLCVMDNLGPSRGLELAARCVVETGTAALYTLLQRISPEPVLRDLTGRIKADEVRHYKYFYHYFLDYRDREHLGRMPVLRTLWRRVAEIEDEDSYIAFKHVFKERYPGREFRDSDYQVYRQRFRAMARVNFPCGMAVKMFLKPLRLSPRVQRMTVPALSTGARYLLLR